MTRSKYDFIVSQEFDDVVETIIVEEDEIAANEEMVALTNEMEEPHMTFETPVDAQLAFNNVYHRFADYFIRKDVGYGTNE